MSVNDLRRTPDAVVRERVREIREQTNVNIIIAVYVIGIIIWVIVIIVLRIYVGMTIIMGAILLIPIFIFTMGIMNANVIRTSESSQVVGSFYLPFSLLIIIPLLAWTSRDYTGDKKQFIAILVFSIIFILLSIVDAWVRDSWLPYVMHIRSILETIGLVLIIFSLCLYLYDVRNRKTPHPANDKSSVYGFL